MTKPHPNSGTGSRHARFLVWVATAALLVTMPASARGITEGVILWTDCSTPFGAATFRQNYAACRAYIAAVADFMASGRQIGKYRACLPADFSKNDMTDRATKWMKNNPDRHGVPAFELAAAALTAAYPCK